LSGLILASESALSVATNGSLSGVSTQPGATALTRIPYWLRAGTYQVAIGGERYDATVSHQPPYDPAGARIRA
jgi:glycine cleavage system aminomethyltransferase T